MLIQCPECNREVSDVATSCPQCGYTLTDADKTRARQQKEQIERQAAEKASSEKMTKKFWSVINYTAIAVVLIFLWRACSEPSTSEPEPICSESDAWQYAQQAVEGVLKNPDDAEFHNPYGWKVEPDPRYRGQYIVTGQVTATNSFNAKLKQTFTAGVRCENGTWYLGDVRFVD